MRENDLRNLSGSVWRYGNKPTVEEFIARMDFVEEYIASLGLKPTEYRHPDDEADESGRFAERTVYESADRWYRVEWLPFDEKPFIVLEYAEPDVFETLVEPYAILPLDIDPFPYDLPDDIIRQEVRCELGLEPYPEGWNETIDSYW